MSAVAAHSPAGDPARRCSADVLLLSAMARFALLAAFVSSFGQPEQCVKLLFPPMSIRG
jgi:hypothetical protein